MVARPKSVYIQRNYPKLYRFLTIARSGTKTLTWETFTFFRVKFKLRKHNEVVNLTLNEVEIYRQVKKSYIIFFFFLERNYQLIRFLGSAWLEKSSARNDRIVVASTQLHYSSDCFHESAPFSLSSVLDAQATPEFRWDRSHQTTRVLRAHSQRARLSCRSQAGSRSIEWKIRRHRLHYQSKAWLLHYLFVLKIIVLIFSIRWKKVKRSALRS